MPVPPPPNAKRAFNGVLFDIWQWEQAQYDGNRALYECLTRQDTVTTIGFLNAETVLLTRQEQSGREMAFLDFPGGRVEGNESHEDAAKREFLEETGLAIGRIWPFRYVEHRGSTRFAQTVFVAADLHDHVKERHLDPGERITVLPTPWTEVVSMCMRHELRQAEVMLAVVALAYDPGAQIKLREFLKSGEGMGNKE